MDYQEILLTVNLLFRSEQVRLISDLLGRAEEDYLSLRRQQLYDRQASCPWCGRIKYCRNGKDKGSQRFKCGECGHTFTEYTGT